MVDSLLLKKYIDTIGYIELIMYRIIFCYLMNYKVALFCHTSSYNRLVVAVCEMREGDCFQN